MSVSFTRHSPCWKESLVLNNEISHDETVRARNS